MVASYAGEINKQSPPPRRFDAETPASINALHRFVLPCHDRYVSETDHPPAHDGAHPSTKAVGVRAPYASMPDHVHRWIERELGSPVVQAIPQQGGMSPGVAARLLTSSGDRAFVKAAGLSLNPDTPGIYRQENEVLAKLPDLDLIPRSLACYDDGDWVCLLLEDIDGRQPHHPWTEGDVERVFPALAELSAALSPGPGRPAPWPDAPRVEESQASMFEGWQTLTEAAEDLDPWIRTCLDEFVACEKRALAAVAGDTLTHWDIRADNILLTEAGRVAVVDWSWACRSAPWVDTVLACLDLPLSGSEVDPDRLLARLPHTRDADPGDVTALIVAVAGGLLAASRRPPSPGLPKIRAFQKHSAEAFLGWARRRMAGQSTR